jgi:hypothetical protein
MLLRNRSGLFNEPVANGGEFAYFQPALIFLEVVASGVRNYLVRIDKGTSYLSFNASEAILASGESR